MELNSHVPPRNLTNPRVNMHMIQSVYSNLELEVVVERLVSHEEDEKESYDEN